MKYGGTYEIFFNNQTYKNNKKLENTKFLVLKLEEMGLCHDFG